MAVPQNSTVRWFTSEMAGAPQIQGLAGDLVAILDACLINGFGTAAPDGNKITISGGVATVEFSGGNDFEKHSVIEITGATPSELNDVWRVTGVTATTFTFACPGIPDGVATGSITVKRAAPGYWQKPFGDSVKAAYRSTHPDATGFYLRLDDSDGTSRALSPVRGYLSMTDVDTGTDLFPDQSAAPDLNWMRSYETSNFPRRWAVICDSQFVYLMVEMRQNYGFTLYQFGDFTNMALIDDFGCVMTGHRATFVSVPTTNVDQFKLDGSYNGCYLAGSTSAYSGSQKYQRHGLAEQPNFSVTGAGFDFPAVSGGYIFHPVVVSDGQNVRGLMPGARQLLHKSPAIASISEVLETETGQVLFLAFIGTGNTTVNIGAFDIQGPWR